jgi:multiple sugar transport system ATP-binding protein
MTSIQLDGVRKVFDDGHVAVRNVDLEVDDGEFRVLLGPSGCGKSTVLRMIAGLEEVTDGEVRLDGERVNELGPRKRDIAMAFQTHALYPQMTVAENIGFPLKVAGLHSCEIATRVRTVADLLHLADILDRSPGRLSGGQQQRVSLARSIVRSPRLFLMDEPLSNLDAHLRSDARSEILRIQRELRTTTVFVTHDQAEAMAMADRITIMRDGDVVQTGTPTELYSQPANLFVAQFLGSPQMNVMVATVIERGDGYALEIGSQTLALPEPPPAGRPSWCSIVGRRVAVGIRPEALSHVGHGELRTSVASTESLGPEQLVHALIDAPTVELTATGVEICHRRETAISAFVSAHDAVSLWEPFALHVDSAAIHLFDLDTGDALTAA